MEGGGGGFCQGGFSHPMSDQVGLVLGGQKQICIFAFLAKMRKFKISAISLKILTQRVSKQCTRGNFQKNFPLPKNGGHFEFSNFCQKWKNTNLLLSP